MTNQHTDEMREERRHTKPEFNGCIRYKHGEYCQPCVAMASNYTYTGESDRRALFHQYPNEVSDATRYQDALQEAMEALGRIADGGVKDKTTGYMSTMNRSDLRHEASEALATINKLLGEKP